MSQQTNVTAQIQQCIDDCMECHRVCVATVEYGLHMGGKHAAADHIRLLEDCAQICQTCADFLTRGSDLYSRTCATCAEVCTRCADACDRMGDDAQMKRCAEVCRRCAESCLRVVGAPVGAAGA